MKNKKIKNSKFSFLVLPRLTNEREKVECKKTKKCQFKKFPVVFFFLFVLYFSNYSIRQKKSATPLSIY